jgi:Spy/CpxP family protein refolding chaperone
MVAIQINSTCASRGRNGKPVDVDDGAGSRQSYPNKTASAASEKTCATKEDSTSSSRARHTLELAITDDFVLTVSSDTSVYIAAAAQSIRARIGIISAKQRREGVQAMKRKLPIIFAIMLGIALLIATVVVGQQPGQPTPPPSHPNMPPHAQNPPDAPQPPPPPDPLAHVMFPPELIMGHARQLGLTDDQKTFMRSEIQKTTASFQELQWKLQDQMELLHETMKAPVVSEQQALTQLDKVLDIEREIKRLHIGLAIRLKNRLTPEQQEQLQKMRAEHHMGMQSPPEDTPVPME